jgi:hypothetical protein
MIEYPNPIGLEIVVRHIEFVLFYLYPNRINRILRKVAQPIKTHILPSQILQVDLQLSIGSWMSWQYLLRLLLEQINSGVS